MGGERLEDGPAGGVGGQGVYGRQADGFAVGAGQGVQEFGGFRCAERGQGQHGGPQGVAGQASDGPPKSAAASGDWVWAIIKAA